jgi:D-alanyl-D-alanine carboxypeptidase
VAAFAVAVGAVALLVFMAPEAAGPGSPIVHRATASAGASGPARPSHVFTSYGTQLAPPAERITVQFKEALRSGLLFNVRTGQVLWATDPGRVLPIASLTKMMTALVTVDHSKPGDRALITTAATHFVGSGVGLLPLGKRVPVEALLYGLLLPSGNDAAIALAQHVAGNQRRFVEMMNARAQAMGLRCSHFSSVSGIVDRDNYSCATDLAVLAHAVLGSPRLGPIVGSRSAILPFPIKGGKLYLYNNNPLLLLRYPGADGVKTGFTDAAGVCLVATARRGQSWLGVVLLHSADATEEAEKLLDEGFARLAATAR